MPLVQLPVEHGKPGVAIHARVSSASSRTAEVIDPAFETIVFFHPAWLDGYFYYPQFDDPVLYEHFNLVALDTPGHGQSSMAGAWPGEYTVHDVVGHFNAALLSLGGDRIHLVGVGEGAVWAYHYAASFPGSTRSYTTFSYPACHGGAAEESYVDCLETVMDAVKHQDIEMLDNVTTAVFEYGLGASFSATIDGLKEEYAALWHRLLTDERAIDDARAIWTPLITRPIVTVGAASRVDVPLLAVQASGTESDHVPMFNAINSLKPPLAPRIRCVVVDNAPHWMTLTSPDMTNKMIADFCAAPLAAAALDAGGPISPVLSARRPSTPRDISGFRVPPPVKLPPGIMSVGEALDAEQRRLDAIATTTVIVEVEVVTDDGRWGA